MPFYKIEILIRVDENGAISCPSCEYPAALPADAAMAVFANEINKIQQGVTRFLAAAGEDTSHITNDRIKGITIKDCFQ